MIFSWVELFHADVPPLYLPERQKTFGVLTFSGSIEMGICVKKVNMEIWLWYVSLFFTYSKLELIEKFWEKFLAFSKESGGTRF